MIGGSVDPQCSSTSRDTYELVKNASGERVAEVRQNMWQSRAAFGVAVYPNFS